MDELKPINVLVSLHKGYGLGDAVAMSSVLQHLREYRRHWVIDFQAEKERHCVGRGIVANTFAYGTPYPHAYYDAEVLITLFDKWWGFTDRPNTRVSSCLRQHFDLDWDAECGRYYIDISQKALEAAQVLIRPRQNKQPCKIEAVAIHYQGDSAPDRKNLTHEQAAGICKIVEKLGCTPLLLDWRNASPLPDDLSIRTTGRIPKSSVWGANPEMNCAVISQCVAFIGIDSGPAKCASATNTPSLVVWTKHHPAPYHDPALNTTHLVPRGYHSLGPVHADRSVTDWFERHYRVEYYECDLVGAVGTWLRELLK